MARRNGYVHDLSDYICSLGHTGAEFEDDFEEALFTRNPKEKLTKTRGTELDKNEGTDFFHQGLRLDTTLDFSNKDTMPYVFDSKIPATGFQNFQIGIRHGNKHNGYTEFPEPVVVIGLDMEPYLYRLNKYEIMKNITAHADEIFRSAEDAYVDYTSNTLEDREDLIDQPLRPNKNYRQPKAITEIFYKCNLMQDTVMNQKSDYQPQ